MELGIVYISDISKSEIVEKCHEIFPNHFNSDANFLVSTVWKWTQIIAVFGYTAVTRAQCTCEEGSDNSAEDKTHLLYSV